MTVSKTHLRAAPRIFILMPPGESTERYPRSSSPLKTLQGESRSIDSGWDEEEEEFFNHYKNDLTRTT
jgi:hypothetical protein